MGELRELRERDERMASGLATFGGGRIGKTGRETLRVSQEAYFNAVDVNGGVDQTGRTVWSDEGFVQDMKRRHPHIVPPDGKIFVGGRGDGGGTVRNRFGRVKERIRFEGGKRVVETF
jgi:hypothetical protein